MLPVNQLVELAVKAEKRIKFVSRLCLVPCKKFTCNLFATLFTILAFHSPCFLNQNVNPWLRKLIFGPSIGLHLLHVLCNAVHSCVYLLGYVSANEISTTQDSKLTDAQIFTGYNGRHYAQYTAHDILRLIQ